MRLLRIAFCAVLLTACASIAQTKPGDVMADVPFSFVAAGQTFAPGHYIVAPFNEYSLRIHDLKNHGTFIPVHSAQRRAGDHACKMVFHRYGDTYFLAEVWGAGNPNGKALYPSHAEGELAAKGTVKEDRVIATK